MAPEERDHVFGKFYRGAIRENGMIAGSGLGLYLARRIVESHGGELTVGPAAEQGAVFCFNLEAVS